MARLLLFTLPLYQLQRSWNWPWCRTCTCTYSFLPFLRVWTFSETTKINQVQKSFLPRFHVGFMHLCRCWQHRHQPFKGVRASVFVALHFCVLYSLVCEVLISQWNKFSANILLWCCFHLCKNKIIWKHNAMHSYSIDSRRWDSYRMKVTGEPAYLLSICSSVKCRMRFSLFQNIFTSDSILLIVDVSMRRYTFSYG